MNPDIMAELDSIFYPKSIAVIGVSTTGENQGHSYVAGHLAMGFPRIYPVNPKGGNILGLEVYPSIKDIPVDVDVAILTISRELVPGMIRECAHKRVKGMFIFTAGFREQGAEGRRLEQQIISIAREGGVRVIGPNAMGIYNPAARTTIGGALPLESGHLGMICQSGYMANSFIMAAAARGIRFSKVISCGNESDLNCADFLDYLGQDTATKIIVAYLEGVREGRRFLQLAREISPRKPIIVWKGGMTQGGDKAAASHTGALAISGDIWRALCSQAGIISVDSVEQMLDTVTTFYFLPLLEGRRIGIISCPGSYAVTASDACVEAGFKLAELSSQSKNDLEKVVEPVGTSIKNPVDVGIPGAFAPEFYFKETTEILGRDPGVDLLLLIFTGIGNTDESKHRKIADTLFKTIRDSGKPVALTNPPPVGTPGGYLALLVHQGIPLYPDPRRAARALSKLAQYSEFLKAAKGS